MATLENIKRMGFFPFRPAHYDSVISMFESQPGARLLDPCAGEGSALNAFANAWRMTPYGNELDYDRFERLESKIGRSNALYGDLMTLTLPEGGVQVCWCNPPYMDDWGERGKRTEFTHLRKIWPFVQDGGYVIWVVYAQHLMTDPARFFAQNASCVDVYKISDPDLEKYTQILVVAQKAQRQKGLLFDPAEMVRRAKLLDFPELKKLDEPIYVIPEPKKETVWYFSNKGVPASVLFELTERDGAQHRSNFHATFDVRTNAHAAERPMMPLRENQLGLLIGAGLMDGIVLEDEHGRFAVRAVIRYEGMITNETELEGGIVRLSVQQSPQVTVTKLYLTGEVEDISNDEALAGFVRSHSNELLEHINNTYKPLYDGDYSKYADVLSVPFSNGLYENQKHIIAATLNYLERRGTKGSFMAAEPRTGKTVMSLTVLLAMSKTWKQGDFAVVTCPSHLVGHWRDEIKNAGLPIAAKIVENIEDAVEFMRTMSKTLPNLMIMSLNTAKLNEDRHAAAHKSPFLRDEAGEPMRGTVEYTDDSGNTYKELVILPAYRCPSCSTAIFRDKETKKGKKTSERELASTEWLDKNHRYCEACGTPLWTDDRRFGVRTDESGNRIETPMWAATEPYVLNETRVPRMAVSDYLKRITRHRIALYICDEVHEGKNLGTGANDTIMTLMNMARKAIGLTGTLYSGMSSSVYALSYPINPTVRAMFPVSRRKRATQIKHIYTMADGTTRTAIVGTGLDRQLSDLLDGTVETSIGGKRVIPLKREDDKPRSVSTETINVDGKAEWPILAWAWAMGAIKGTVEVTQEAAGDMGSGKMIDASDMKNISEAPGISPSLVKLLLPNTVFIGMLDIKPDMVPIHEMPHGTAMTPKIQISYDKLVASLKAKLFGGRGVSKSAVWKYLLEQTQFINAPWRHAEFNLQTGVAFFPYSIDDTYPKEKALLDLLRAEFAEGRGVVICLNQTDTTDIGTRLIQKMKMEFPGKKFHYMRDENPKGRPDLVRKLAEDGIDVIVTNPVKIAVGMDLTEWPTAVFMEQTWSLQIFDQVKRRAWSFRQEQDVCIVMMYATNTLEANIIQALSEKGAAANLLYGIENAGLSALSISSASIMSSVIKAFKEGRVGEADLQSKTLGGAKPAPKQLAMVEESKPEDDKRKKLIQDTMKLVLEGFENIPPMYSQERTRAKLVYARLVFADRLYAIFEHDPNEQIFYSYCHNLSDPAMSEFGYTSVREIVETYIDLRDRYLLQIEIDMFHSCPIPFSEFIINHNLPLDANDFRDPVVAEAAPEPVVEAAPVADEPEPVRVRQEQLLADGWKDRFASKGRDELIAKWFIGNAVVLPIRFTGRAFECFVSTDNGSTIYKMEVPIQEFRAIKERGVEMWPDNDWSVTTIGRAMAGKRILHPTQTLSELCA